MSKDKKVEEVKEEVMAGTADTIPVEVPKEPEVPAAPKEPEVFMSFEHWCSVTGQKPRHIAGMKVFCKDVHMNRTLEQWSKIFASY